MKSQGGTRFTNLDTAQSRTLRQICFDKYQGKISGQARSRISGFRSFQYKKLFVLRTIITGGNEEEREKRSVRTFQTHKVGKESSFSLGWGGQCNIIFILDLELHGFQENFTTI